MSSITLKHGDRVKFQACLSTDGTYGPEKLDWIEATVIRYMDERSDPLVLVQSDSYRHESFYVFASSLSLLRSDQ